LNSLPEQPHDDGHDLQGQDAALQAARQVERGEEVIIARGRTPVARLVPYAPEQPKRGFGSMKGRATIGPEFWEPLPEEELKLWEGG
jgi:antitoxin (DNA-binding transcriptional repressor) of toxin-antitoxin stability system